MNPFTRFWSAMKYAAGAVERFGRAMDAAAEEVEGRVEQAGASRLTVEQPEALPAPQNGTGKPRRARA